MSSSPLALSVVICAYTEERWNELLRGVESVLRQTVPAREIVVAVDHNPQLLDRARAHFEGSAVVVANEARPGLAGARNSGARATSTPIVAFLDDDARANPDWLAQLAQAYGAASILGVGGRIEPDWPAARPRWFPQEFNWVVGCSYRGLPTTAAPVRNMIGANMSVRRDVLDALGGFSEDLGRLEETDFCIRGRQRFPEALLARRGRDPLGHAAARHLGVLSSALLQRGGRQGLDGARHRPPRRPGVRTALRAVDTPDGRRAGVPAWPWRRSWRSGESHRDRGRPHVDDRRFHTRLAGAPTEQRPGRHPAAGRHAVAAGSLALAAGDAPARAPARRSAAADYATQV
jgi:hypothetical protein